MESGSCSAAHSNTTHQLRVGSGKQSAEETARGSGPAEWKQSSWKPASAPAKSRQVKNPSGGSLFPAFGSKAELTSATALPVSSRQQSMSPFLSTAAVNSGHDESSQGALTAWLQLLNTTDLSRPLCSNYRQAKMSSFNQSPKQASEVALNLKLYQSVSRFGRDRYIPRVAFISDLCSRNREIFYHGCHFSTQTFSPIGIDWAYHVLSCLKVGLI